MKPKVRKIINGVIAGLMVVAIALTTIALSGCSHTGLVTGAAAPKTAQVDREDFIDEVVAANQSLTLVSSNATINSFILAYNANQSDSSLKIADGYKVYKSKDTGAYYIKSSGANLCIRTDSNGDILIATPNTTNGTEQVGVSMAIMDVLWGKEFVPSETKAYMVALLGKVEMVSEEIGYKTAEFQSKIKSLNTTLPNIPEPSISGDIKAIYEQAKESVDKMFNIHWNGNSVNDISLFGKESSVASKESNPATTETPLVTSGNSVVAAGGRPMMADDVTEADAADEADDIEADETNQAEMENVDDNEPNDEPDDSVESDDAGSYGFVVMG